MARETFISDQTKTVIPEDEMSTQAQQGIKHLASFVAEREDLHWVDSMGIAGLDEGVTRVLSQAGSDVCGENCALELRFDSNSGYGEKTLEITCPAPYLGTATSKEEADGIEAEKKARCTDCQKQVGQVAVSWLESLPEALARADKQIEDARIALHEAEQARPEVFDIRTFLNPT